MRGDELYPDKPPLLMWLQAIFYSLTGSVRFSFLLPSLLASLGTLALVRDLGRRLWNPQAGAYAAWALLFAFQSVSYTHLDAYKRQGLLRIGLLPGAQAQSEIGATYAHKVEKSEAPLDWMRPADELACKVRAFNPWPIAEAMIDGERVRIHGAIAVPGGDGAAPGLSLIHI